MAADEKRMQLRGLHHVTAICRDAERTIAFYRDVLGLAVVHDGPSDDDPESRHVWFGALDGAPGMLVSFMQYPELPTGVVGVGSTHHFALVVESAEELEAWRDYLRSQDVECTDVFDRGAFRSIYIRDPAGHIVDFPTRGPGLPAGGPSVLGRADPRRSPAVAAASAPPRPLRPWRTSPSSSRRRRLPGARRAHGAGGRSSSRSSSSPTWGSRRGIDGSAYGPTGAG